MMAPRLVWLAALGWMGFVLGCFSPRLPEGLACGTGSSPCPPGQTCAPDGRCYSSTSDDATPGDGPIDVPMIDADLTCTCADPMTISCASGPRDCPLGCVEDPTGRCQQIAPSNGVTLDGLDGLTLDVVVDGGIATFNTSTGEISGVVMRAPGEGLVDGILYEKRTFLTATLGVFTLKKLTVTPNSRVRLVGNRSAVIVTTQAIIDGTILGGAGCSTTDSSCGGPGGGDGGAEGKAATGCAPGQPGTSAMTMQNDGGGGGGGGGRPGGAGGDSGTFLGGSAGVACIDSTAEPLVGGSGGGIGGKGGALAAPPGGGGGGAFQLVASESIVVAGTIHVGGGGGRGGPAGEANSAGLAAAGAGGGSGGAILLEAISVSVPATGVLAANGGGGGGGGANDMPGGNGEDAIAGTAAAMGGTTPNTANGRGGNGGAFSALATPGMVSSTSNAGGGGGGVGVIFVRTIDNAMLLGTFSPNAGVGAVRSN